MCYSVESSAKTTLMSVIATIILLQSNIPHFQWLGFTLIGWGGMQFAELLLWLTDPRKTCTTANKLITTILIPFILILNALCPVLGSFFVKSWSHSNENRRLFILLYSIVSTTLLIIYFYGSPDKYCTTVTKEGHLDWWVSQWSVLDFKIKRLFATTVWQLVIILPFIVLWDISYKAVVTFCILPLIGFYLGFKTDANGSIWCHYASFTSIVSLIMYGLYKFNIYKFNIHNNLR